MSTMSGLPVLYVVILGLLTGVFSQLTEEERQVFIDGGVTITDDESDPDSYWIFSHHGIPDHDYGDFPNADNPNEVTQQDHEYKIPKVPNVLETPGCLRLGTIAAAFNGIPLFNPYSGFGYNAVEGENPEVFDECNGHPEPQGAYHYHQMPNCLMEAVNDQLVAVALDGYPIYGPLNNGRNLTSADLDDCHGWVNSDTGRYEYRITYDYPYVMGCFRGEATVQSGAPSRKKRQGQRPPPGGGGENNGFGPDSCLYVTFCENPGLGCPDTAYTFSGDLAEIPSNSTDDGDDGDTSNLSPGSPMSGEMVSCTLMLLAAIVTVGLYR